MTINTNEIDHVLKAWGNNFIEDVPALHVDGKYLIEYDVLVEHMNNINYDTLVSVMVEMEANYFRY